MKHRPLFPRMAIALLALLGLFDALYLSITFLKPQDPMMCPTGEGCELVQTSIWSTIPPGNGIPVAFLGVAGYALLLALALTALHRDRIAPLPVPTTLLLVALAGLIFSFYLVGVQVLVIHAICFWCLMSSVLEMLIAGLALIDWRFWRRAA